MGSDIWVPLSCCIRDETGRNEMGKFMGLT